MKTFPCLAFIVVLPTALLVAGGNSQTPQIQPVHSPANMPSQNPHWRDDGCGVCHSINAGTVVPISRDEVDLLCLGCHNGAQAPREPHPIGRLFSGDQVRRPDSWPVVNDRLSCLTCHDVLMHCKPAPRRPATNPVMLRGPRVEGSAWCAQCHVADLHKQHNPHIMIDPHGSPRSESCRFCHSADVSHGSAHRTGDARLNSPEPTLCAQCHRQHLDFFSPGHIGITPSAAVLEQMIQTDIRLRAVLTPDHATHAALPLSNGQVVCSTCHNPHQEGVFAKNSGLGLGALRWPREPNQIPAQRLPGRELCSACHGF